MQICMHKFQSHEDDRGQLVAVEANRDIPFEIKRVYYLYGITTGASRGYHAHKSLQQVLVCIHGSCKILLDDGIDKATVTLNSPQDGLFIDNAIWREMYDFSSDAVLLVFASDYYDESDYIRDYNAFLEYKGVSK